MLRGPSSCFRNVPGRRYVTLLDVGLAGVVASVGVMFYHLLWIAGCDLFSGSELGECLLKVSKSSAITTT